MNVRSIAATAGIIVLSTGLLLLWYSVTASSCHYPAWLVAPVPLDPKIDHPYEIGTYWEPPFLSSRIFIYAGVFILQGMCVAVFNTRRGVLIAALAAIGTTTLACILVVPLCYSEFDATIPSAEAVLAYALTGLFPAAFSVLGAMLQNSDSNYDSFGMRGSDAAMAGPLSATAPVKWTAPLVRDRDYLDVVRLYAVYEAEWETAKHESAPLVMESRPDFRRCPNSRDGNVKVFEEEFSRARILFEVPRIGRLHLVHCEADKDDGEVSHAMRAAVL